MTEKRSSGRGSRPDRREKSTGRRSLNALLYVLCVFGVSLLLACLCWIAACDVLALNKTAATAEVSITSDMMVEKTVTASDGTASTESVADIGKVADTLKDNGLIQYKALFRVFAVFSHASTKISTGTYELNTDMDYRALISGMSATSGSRVSVSVTIPEGYTEAQVFQLLEDKGVASVDDLNEMAATHDYAFSFLEDLPLGDATRLEGYLYPDTYEFYLDQDPLYVINKMLQNFDSKFDDSMRQQAADMGYSVHDIVIIASLIEKETDGSDQRNISSVIYNRLKGTVTGGYLQLDSTIQYLLPERTESLTDEELAIDSPYNTYKYKGLPAGAISNPGMQSLKAALNPNDTNYYFFLLDNSGVTQFYSSYKAFSAAKAALDK